MQPQEIKDLIKKYNQGKCSEEEKSILEAWYLQFEFPGVTDLATIDRTADLNAIWHSLPINKKKVLRIRVLYRAAAVLAIGFFAGLYLYNTNKVDRQEQVIQTIAQGLKPGTNKATLRLSNGTQLDLSDASYGQLASQQGATISKTADGIITYQSKSSTDTTVNFNIMSTPAGGTYELTLSDGTLVTLDASSSIKFPVRFFGKERRVAVTGQAYFKVSHDSERPFRVTTQGQTVEVLGTEFNIINP